MISGRRTLLSFSALRRWFHENPQEHWEGFVSLYSKELENSDSVKDFVERIKSHDRITLLYASKDTHNHASVLRQFLQKSSALIAA